MLLLAFAIYSNTGTLYGSASVLSIFYDEKLWKSSENVGRTGESVNIITMFCKPMFM